MLSGQAPPLQRFFVWMEHLDKFITNRKWVFLSIETTAMLWLHISKLGKGLWNFCSLHWLLLHVDVLESSCCSHEQKPNTWNQSRLVGIHWLVLWAHACRKAGSRFSLEYKLSFLGQGRWTDVSFRTLCFTAFRFGKFCGTSFETSLPIVLTFPLCLDSILWDLKTFPSSCLFLLL